MKILDYCREFPKHAFDPGDSVLSEGTQTGLIYILIEGTVEVTKNGVTLAKVSEPGSIFGEVSALLNTPHMADVKATALSRFYVVEDARDFLRSNAEVGLVVATLLAQRLSTVTNNLTAVKRSVDTLIQQQTSPGSKSVVAPIKRKKPFIGVLSVGTFHRGMVAKSE